MLRLKVFVNEKQIDDLKICNKGAVSGNKSRFHLYDVVRDTPLGSYLAVKGIAHDRSDPWHMLAGKVCEELGKECSHTYGAMRAGSARTFTLVSGRGWDREALEVEFDFCPKCGKSLT